MYSDDRDELIERVAAELRHPERLSADFDLRVMSMIRERPRTSRFASLTDWLLTPRSVQLSPAGAFAAVALAAVLVFATWEISRREHMVPGAAQVAAMDAAAEGVQVVQFVFVAPRASTVSLVGDFNGWDTDATPMQRRASAGVWTVSLTLPVGRHQYSFVVDREQWAADPAAPPAVSDDFGTPSSVITVAAGSDA